MGEPSGFWSELRQDPRHATEIAIRHAQPLLAPHVEMWWSKTHAARPSEPPDRTARRVLRRSAGVARRGGLVTGSSFYVGMPPALAMIYCEQVVLVLRIAAAFGRDPTDPLRAAEYLYLQGRYPTARAAAKALDAALHPVARPRHPPSFRSALQVVGQLPSMIGLHVLRFRKRSIVEKAIAVLEIASYFVPLLSLPIWAFANARSTRRLGRAAIDFYRQAPDESGGLPALVLPSRPDPRTRRLLIGTAVPLALAMGALFSFLPLGWFQHGIRWLGLAIGETVIALTFARLVRLTRVPKTGATYATARHAI